MAKQTGKDPAVLYAVPALDAELLYLYDHFCEVKGQDPLTYRELDAWQNLTGVKLSPGELEVLFVLDAAFYENQRKNG